MLRHVAFAAYCALVIAGAVAHEPWRDEAQAWLIARDAPPLELFTRVLRYEGHPPLWYLLLAIPARLGLPYASLKVIGALAGAASAALLIYAFPRVPLGVRLLAPFAFFIAWQYTVVARSYVLLLPLLLWIAKAYERPKTVALLLILLSHVSVHGFAMACGLFALQLPRMPKRSTVLFALNAIVLVLLLWPPPDNTTDARLSSMLEPGRHAELVSAVVPGLFWHDAGDDIRKVAVALVIVTLLALWIWRSGAGAPFAAALLGVYAIALRYFSLWHEGLFFLVFLFGAVLAFHKRASPRWLEVAGQLALIVLLVRHAEWTFRSLADELRHESTGSERAADAIRARGLDRRVLYATGMGMIEVQPYFHANVFDNYRFGGRAYWDWSSRNAWPYVDLTPASEQAMARFMDGVLADRPEAILFGAGTLEDRLFGARLFTHPSYRQTGVFTGRFYWKEGPAWETRYHLFERVHPVQSRP